MRTPLALLQDKEGNWKSVQTSTSARGYDAEQRWMFVREPTVEETQTLQLCLRRSKGRMHILEDMLETQSG